MKRIVFFIVLMAVCESLFSQEKGKINIGMDIKEFKKIYPSVIPKNAPDSGQWERSENLFDLAGSWAYNFKDGKLDWCIWDIYIDSINQKNFNKCLWATEVLIAEYTEDYGTPYEYSKTDTIFKDPYIDRHWGYEVLNAKWKTGKVKFKIGFTFMGGKGQYHFLVKMGFFRNNYPYFD